MRQRRGPELAWTCADGRRIYRVRGLAGAHVHLVARRGGSLVVDAGFPEDAPLVADACRAAFGADEPVEAILLTHYHMDHASGAGPLSRLLHAPLLASAADNAVFRRERPYVRLPVDLTPSMQTFVDNSELWRRFARSTDDWFPVVDREIAPGERLAGFEVLAAPGHTPGCVVLWDEGERALISADYLVYPKELLPRFFRDFLRAVNLDRARALETTRRLLALPVERLFPSHGEYLLEGAAREAAASDLYRDLAAPAEGGAPG